VNRSQKEGDRTEAPIEPTVADGQRRLPASATALMPTVPMQVAADARAADAEAATQLHAEPATRQRPARVATPGQSPELRALRSLPVKALAPAATLGYQARGNDAPARRTGGGKRILLIALASAVLGGVAAAFVGRPEPPPKPAPPPSASASAAATPTSR
jgi:hypothetical protein